MKCSNMRYSCNFITALSFKRQGTNCAALVSFFAATLKLLMMVSVCCVAQMIYPQRISKWGVWNKGDVPNACVSQHVICCR